MDQARLQRLIGRGLGLCGSITGAPYAQYRPIQAIDPTKSEDPIATLNCAFDFGKELQELAPTPPGHPFVLMLVDPGLVEVGDLLVGPTTSLRPETYFVSRTQILQPAWAVLCNASLDVLNVAPPTSIGTNAYGGLAGDPIPLLASGWPASMLAKTRGEADVTKLPSDTRAAYYDVYLPPIPNLTIGIGMQLQDLNGQTYMINSWELSAYGWKLLAGLATT